MTLQLRDKNGVSYLVSDLLAGIPGIDHAFSTRVGGVSAAPHDSLNLGFYSDDSDENVTRNWDRLLEAMGARLDGVWYQSQCHGTTVREAPEVSGYAVLGQGDALWSREPGAGLAIITADCVPVLAATKDGQAVAAMHAGWRGMAGGVVEATLADLTRGFGASASGMLFAAGPHIRECCFEVKEDVARPFADRFGEDTVIRTGERATVSLDRALRKILERAGVPSESIDISDACTACRQDLFFSYRRAQGKERGRMGSIIGKRGEAVS